jgi:hypothetical protein
MIFADEFELCDDEIHKAVKLNAPNDYGGFSVTNTTGSGHGQ